MKAPGRRGSLGLTARRTRLAPRRYPGGVPRRRRDRRRPARPDDAAGRDRARRAAAACSPDRAGFAPRQVVPDVVLGRHDDLEAVLGLRPRAATWSPSTTSTSRPSTSRRWWPTGVAVRPGPGALLYAQDKARDAGAARPRSACPARAWRPVDRPGRGRRVRRARRAGRSCSRPPAAATTARASGSCGRRRRGRAGDRVRGAARRRAARRGSGALRPRAGRAGGALAARAGRGLAGGRDRAARRHLPRGLRPGPGLDAEPRAEAQRIALTHRRGARRHRHARGRAVRDRRTAGLLVNELAMRPHNSGHWTIDGAVTSQFENHLRAVLDLPLGAPEPARAAGRDGQRARRSTCPTSTRRTCTAWPATRA